MQYENAAESSLEGQIGIYGWRKRCLYALVLGLMVVVLCNLVATMLLLNVLNFNLSGIGALSISASGAHLRDYSYVLDSLVTSRLSSRQGQPLSFEGSYNLSMVLGDAFGKPTQSLKILSDIEEPNKHEVIATASQFIVNDPRGRSLFSAEDGQVTVGADILRVLEGGVHFTGSIQTSMLRSSLGNELMLESATRRLYLKAPEEVSIESRAADISASCLTNLQLVSTDGKVKMKAPGIYIPNLESIPLKQPQPSRYFQLETASPSNNFQVCMCSNGKLFVSQPNGECSVDNDGFQCRNR